MYAHNQSRMYSLHLTEDVRGAKLYDLITVSEITTTHRHETHGHRSKSARIIGVVEHNTDVVGLNLGVHTAGFPPQHHIA